MAPQTNDGTWNNDKLQHLGCLPPHGP